MINVIILFSGPKADLGAEVFASVFADTGEGQVLSLGRSAELSEAEGAGQLIGRYSLNEAVLPIALTAARQHATVDNVTGKVPSKAVKAAKPATSSKAPSVVPAPVLADVLAPVAASADSVEHTVKFSGITAFGDYNKALQALGGIVEIKGGSFAEGEASIIYVGEVGSVQDVLLQAGLASLLSVG